MTSPTATQTQQAPVEEANLQVNEETDSAYGDSQYSETTSVNSSVYNGVFVHGRRYQSLKDNADYWGPADQKQFDSMATSHLVSLVYDKDEAEPLFRSPIPSTATRVLDIGTGEGSWAIDVADKFPHLDVLGIDLYPPPQTWVPPNCTFEVDDASKPWTFSKKFDFIHLRYMLGSFTREQWAELYAQAYAHLAPGGWIEQMETSIVMRSDDGTIPEDSVMKTWSEVMMRCGEKAGRPLDTAETCKSGIEKAGFVEVKEKVAKYPTGSWPKDPRLREVGRLREIEAASGLEGYIQFLLTHFGEPQPWSVEESQVYTAKMRNDLTNPKIHKYTFVHRVWARKPFDNEKTSAPALAPATAQA